MKHKYIILLSLVLGMSVSARQPIIVSILPQKTFTEKIGGDQVEVHVMVQPGSSPHTYEPKPSQMKQVATATLYLAIGVEFEAVWLPKFRDLNPTLPITDISAGITRRAMQEKHATDTKALDPHIWTSPTNVRTIAQNTLKALQHADPKHADLYQANCDAFLKEIHATDARLHALLDPLPKGTAFMVMHPSWGYFADAYGLRQMPMQIAGKSPKPRELVSLIKQARSQHVRAVFTQPEFSDSLASVLARELHIPVRKVSPMAPDWSANLLRLATDIAGKRETNR
jgi:zinc transport system substrate-binding protein